MPLRQLVGRNIRSAQVAAGLTSEQIARQLDVSLNTVKNWRRGDFLPARNLGALCALLDVSPAWLFTTHPTSDDYRAAA
jgi:transcriptional regulator with XRE-family HTH domain